MYIEKINKRIKEALNSESKNINIENLMQELQEEVNHSLNTTQVKRKVDEVWGKELKQCINFCAFSIDILKWVQKNRDTTKIEEDKDVVNVLTHLLNRMHNTYNTVLILSEVNKIDEAFVLCRNLYELYVISNVVLKDEKAAKVLMDYIDNNELVTDYIWALDFYNKERQKKGYKIEKKVRFSELSEYALCNDGAYTSLNSMYKESCYLNHATPLYLMNTLEREGFNNLHIPLLYATFFMQSITLNYIQKHIRSLSGDNEYCLITSIGVYVNYANKTLQSLEKKGNEVYGK